jgi:hypothetical protein
LPQFLRKWHLRKNFVHFFFNKLYKKRLNFIIYGISCQKYRKEFLRIFTNICCFFCSFFFANASKKSNILSKSTHRDPFNRHHHNEHDEHVNNRESVKAYMDKRQIFIRIEENSLYDLVVVLEEEKQRRTLNNNEHDYSNETFFVKQKTVPPYFSSTRSI